MRKVFLRSTYNYDAGVVSRETKLNCDPDGCVTQQQFKEESDINTIVKRFGLTGTVPLNYKPPLSGDFTEVSDFHTAMNAVRAADEAFMQMPAALRKKFNHDPQELMAFLDKDSNREEAMKLGLVNRPIELPRDAVKAIDELAAKIVPRETKP